ncbi:trehalose-6-phosphate synthase [Egibacter rhizosphaerae]|uniref:Trehalose-6-phosphate synthase n=1 Tax=Egibacter rhizosphaerae TaxID=1670831 RepID=A0A411YAN2_9ACTN|nr:trehalose-6-phosphate synthase [Egibacter rhizosphaerae]QBI18283.1 trehalose-6-phosphate synthase [Egibacter rhizosphaerae]
MQTDQLLIASNRGPVRFAYDENGDLESRRGFGGLVTALGGALQDEPGTWVSVALSDTDRRVAAEHPGTFEVDADGSRFRLSLVDPGYERFEAYYNRIANELLWFTVHGMWNAPYEPHRPWSSDWRDGYLPVNRQVAEAVLEAGGDRPEVHLHDYHLLTAGRTIRAHWPEAPILSYIHTPWARPRELAMLPDEVARDALEGLLQADVVVTSAPEWSSALRRCTHETLGARLSGETVEHEWGRTRVTDVVLGVDETALVSAADAPATREAGERLDASRDGRRLIVRVDRTDLSKNIARGLQAFELLLERHPEHRERVQHLAICNPSRQSVPAYRAYVEHCEQLAARIAERFGEQTIDLRVVDDYPAAIAALQRYDVLLANPVRDGTNLVAKEGPALNHADGVLVLSREAGAVTTLSGGAITVNPFDVEDQAAALHLALTMDAGERAERANRLRGAVTIGAPEEWLGEQRRLLREAVEARRG